MPSPSLRNMALRKTTRRSRRTPAISYREWSSSSEHSLEDDGYDEPRSEPNSEETEDTEVESEEFNALSQVEPQRKKRKIGTSTRTRRAPPVPRRRAHQATATNSKAKASPAVKEIPTDHATSAWSTLPYEILFTIFRYAATPLRDELLFRPLPSIQWLINTAQTCQAFKEPALAVLYESPPLTDLSAPHQLLALLKDDSPSWSMAYASKIKTLEIDAPRTLGYRAPGWGLIEVAKLLTHMPQLSDINLRDSSDSPPFRRLSVGRLWTYPANLIDALSASDLQLRKFHWHAHMMKESTSGGAFLPSVADAMRQTHSTKPFAQLQELSLSRLGPSPPQRSPKKGADDPVSERIRLALEPLKRLRVVSILSCSAFEESWPEVLASLPTDLHSLTITNTQTLDSAAIRDFLHGHGAHLKELVLDHNQSLGLSFTEVLQDSCPQLERLHMDLTFYDQVAHYEDHKPLFDTLLLPTERPTWPKSLRSLELYNLRKWTSDAAENFFKSLIDSAHEMARLRYLIIKAILDISWRDRASFREMWINSLHDVFLRCPKHPDPRLASKRAFRDSGPYHRSDDGCVLSAERSATDSDDEKPLKAESETLARRSKRIESYHAEKTERADTPVSDTSLEDIPRRAWKSSSMTIVQGLCEIVDINIDNNRPGEVQFHEDDFLDTDPGEDEEWVE